MLKGVRGRLDSWICRTNDQGQMPERPEARLKWDRRFERRWKERMTDKLGYSPDEKPEKYLDYWQKRLEKEKAKSST